MVRAFPLALAQLGDPRVRRVLVKAVLVTIILFAAAAAGIGWLLVGTNPCGWGPLSWECTIGGGGGVAAALLFAVLGMWLLFPAVAMGVLGFFSDEVVGAVEARHYPDAAARARPATGLESLAMGAQSAGRLLFWNVLAIPGYLLLLVTGLGPFLLFFAVNALALGRDLGEMVAVRHHRGPALKAWLAATRGRRALLGLFVTWLFMIPFANLLAPAIGAAMATHLFHAEGQ
jgi:CysZ protein